jgi:hypothetical protein
LKTMEEQGVGARSLVCSTLGIEGHVGVPGWDNKEWQAFHRSHKSTQTKQQVG